MFVKVFVCLCLLLLVCASPIESQPSILFDSNTMATTSFYVLFESAAGYALFSVLESEEISTLAQEVQSNLNDFSKFQRIVKMTSFLPFLTAESALENINAITEHELTEELKVNSLSFSSFLLFIFCLFFYSHFQLSIFNSDISSIQSEQRKKINNTSSWSCKYFFLFFNPSLLLATNNTYQPTHS